LLPVLVPGGRVAGDFALRCLRLARARREILEVERAGRGAGIAIAPRGSRRRDPAPRGAVPAARVRARLGRLAADYPGNPEEGLAPGELALPGTRWLVDRRGALRERAVIPGSAIVVGPPLRSGRTGLAAVAHPRGTARWARRAG